MTNERLLFSSLLVLCSLKIFLSTGSVFFVNEDSISLDSTVSKTMVTSRVSREPTTDDAVSYLLAVEEKLKNDPATYDEFLKLMKDYRDDDR